MASLGSAKYFGDCDQIKKLEHVQIVAEDIFVKPHCKQNNFEVLVPFLEVVFMKERHSNFLKGPKETLKC